jgi:hypothetical protein
LHEEEQRVGELRAKAVELLAKVENLEQKRMENDEELTRLRQSEVLLKEANRALQEHVRDRDAEKDQAAAENKQLRAQLAAQQATITRLECSLQSKQTVSSVAGPNWEPQLANKHNGEKPLVEVLQKATAVQDEATRLARDTGRDAQVQEKMVRAWTVESAGSGDRFGTPTRGLELDGYAQGEANSPTSSTSPSSFGVSPMASPISQRARAEIRGGSLVVAPSLLEPIGGGTIVEE